jgi:hypothetical protein
MNSEKTAITVLVVTALLLALALVFLPSRATAQNTIKDGDYLVATMPSAGGNDALYIAETRTTGMFVVLTYDQRARTLMPRAARSLDDAFGPR